MEGGIWPEDCWKILKHPSFEEAGENADKSNGGGGDHKIFVRLSPIKFPGFLDPVVPIITK